MIKDVHHHHYYPPREQVREIHHHHHYHPTGVQAYNYAKEEDGKMERFAEQAAEAADLINVEVEASKVVKKEFTIRNNQVGEDNKTKGSDKNSNANVEGTNSSQWTLVSNNVSSNSSNSTTPPPVLFHCPLPLERGSIPLSISISIS